MVLVLVCLVCFVFIWHSYSSRCWDLLHYWFYLLHYLLLRCYTFAIPCTYHIYIYSTEEGPLPPAVVIDLYTVLITTYLYTVLTTVYHRILLLCYTLPV